jgi:hypothetical protein
MGGGPQSGGGGHLKGKTFASMAGTYQTDLALHGSTGQGTPLVQDSNGQTQQQEQVSNALPTGTQTQATVSDWLRAKAAETSAARAAAAAAGNRSAVAAQAVAKMHAQLRINALGHSQPGNSTQPQQPQQVQVAAG